MKKKLKTCENNYRLFLNFDLIFEFALDFPEGGFNKVKADFS